MARALALVEKAYRGALEKQFFDSLYLATELHRQLGGLDILLRGRAVTYGIEAPPVPALRMGSRTLDTLSDPRRDLRALIAAGVGVWAERDALAAHGLQEAPLLDGVRTVADGETAARWPEYRMVFYL
ncbi:hypothetical protein [Streptomyces alkaliterrae]|uniref:Uncharacterized protein n=1 Tax=Streptomyces alkaliterrae TaxID=2213162 RepID=A0A5P0YJS2_9ACTN|nr:hypothetical protein [Streptomyces alkaliterrae]MBB1252749.1 hypothetical protein [Streptomyces alkaliterrae]MBB1258514.1 hypothetical protein [Streptomyces alkaliterrae]MQS00488.1 hypothetical protein [Streptomyces alkaliterrae]